MRVACIVPVAVLAAGIKAQATGGAVFEPQGFNVTAALESLGVDVSALPEVEPETPGLSGRSSYAPCPLACSSLTYLFGSDNVLYEGSAVYDAFTASYWAAQQGALSPSCVFKPKTTAEVSILVLIARFYQCPFAVRGGGHAAWAGASNIEDGITVSMENFKQVKVSADLQTVDVGPGLRWVDVFTEVEKSGLSVVGGRMAPVGVPGLILGGGISHFSNKRGWACDNVASFQLVTASGIAINVSPTSYADLYWALRGGGNNFGIVTKFKLVAFPLGQMWGGQRIYTEDKFPAILDALHHFTVEGSATDLDAAQIATFATFPGVGKVSFGNLHYAKPIANAPVFDLWANIAAIQDTTGFRTMSGMANLLNEGAPAPGAYETWWGISLKMDRELLTFVIDTFFAQEATVANVEKILLIMAIQPVTTGALNAMQKNGGNALGLNPANGPYFIVNFNAAWNVAADGPQFHQVINNIIRLVKAEAQRRNFDNDFVYMNYGSEYQDPIGSYGAANKLKLQNISKKYDPTQLFQYLHTAGYKLVKGAPNPGPP
ncbi:FAD-binding domain-containing protein [Amniculicola lignicola CBS 123094]|uniref:FAD-binding domain-containing protein n=1 Tax=Amniculicola lignicola CBS 123094 TaxID=1392246 RepID=A0A6A5WT07_9PLEO|nr:FAD-binding domain-containing protein [Amniculicola lignicola CBS 123094]